VSVVCLFVMTVVVMLSKACFFGFHSTAQLSLGSNSLMGSIPIEVTRLTLLSKSSVVCFLVVANLTMISLYSNLCFSIFHFHVQLCLISRRIV
jgi:hypothetical protein